ncbi:hypothetical protein A2662_04395 [Candidatus Giovannonibacteria bacterium RIFCSPHIGHO2_01_FULL_45_33]|uniref:Uncharacterized protein n=1 Tax=Candidatus Giovannonibacteria bacterium RIFCSPLOWO2_01_FULL_45_34 TaxID=1798351 RepID=A0A1F5X0E6_9BACT|nr:MAG: hypothetical protein A2662_04395 [Candidatus Giovannonibacteria bacterium RIFCSPHIGHO2_01_FULL_45_33]OGF70193.1 MAG: hypothetical protein A3C73_04485 [Candidatus Giovannonibacteria bacterium RIFCSPHIGHO2_02_FULL_44_11]OGF81364.1 MAG: hypothetical protein A2930_00620 [Candidatus Giovannonibacteria bacterium RIFCSPLOWO2_01_FULL_45_34]
MILILYVFIIAGILVVANKLRFFSKVNPFLFVGALTWALAMFSSWLEKEAEIPVLALGLGFFAAFVGTPLAGIGLVRSIKEKQYIGILLCGLIVAIPLIYALWLDLI